MTPDRLRFDNLLDLARLPWFRVEGGRLVLADRALGPAVDVHTHLALSYVVPRRLDLRAAHPETEHYLPAERPLDLDLYMNRNLTAADLHRMERDLTLGSLTAGGMRRTHTAPNLVREMNELGIARSVLLPIDFAVLSRNSEDWMEATRDMAELVCFGSAHPLTPRLGRRLDLLRSLGARGVKVHPNVQVVLPDGPMAMRMYRMCGERGLAVFFHCGPVGIEPAHGRYLSQVRHYERAVAENPGVTFVLGHSGALQWEQALGLAGRYPNVWLELASQGLSAVRRIVDEAPPDRVMFGTDWPFYHQAIGLAKVFLATEGRDAQRRAVLWDNAARLLALEPPAA